MKQAYPIILTPDAVGYVVYIPDFNINTEGDSLAEAMEMARDAIGLVGIHMEDDHETIPSPSDLSGIKAEDGIVTLVDVDFTDYRRKNDRRSVRRNVSIPAWLDYAAEKSGINVSAVLQKALKAELKIEEN